jgi:FMN phosphatase YigB (HAD superfamily)
MSASDRLRACGLPAVETRPESWGIDRDVVARVDAAGLLSLDIFDTLLFRAVAHPHDVFTLVGRRALDRGWLPAHLTPEQVRSLRVNAEQRARQKKDRSAPAEVTLAEIWDEMPFAAPHRPQLVDLEVEAESDVCFRNPAIWSLVTRARERGIPVALLSDMYLTRPDIERLLTRAGCALECVDDILVSSEGRGAKWNGELFDRLAERFPSIPRQAMLHIGDNVLSDVERASCAGLQSAHYPAINARLSERIALERLRHGASAGHLDALRRLAASCCTESDAEAAWWFDLGATVLGPFLAAFAEFVVTACAAGEIRIIRPLMREGALLSDLLRVAAAARGLVLDVEPLHVSRAAVWLPSLGRFDDRAINELCTRPHLTTREALVLVGIDVVPAVLAPHADALLSSSSDAESALREFLSRGEVGSGIDTFRLASRERLVRFLQERGGTGERVALVDLGFHGTVGTAIERLMSGATGTRWTQFLAIGAESVERHWFEGRDMRVFVGGPGALADIAPALVRHAAVLEAMLVSGETTVGYVDGAEGVVPVTIGRSCSHDQHEAIGACHRGILAFQRAWLDADASTRRAFSTRDDRRLLCEMLHRLIDFPSAEESDWIGALAHEHNGGSAARERLVPLRPLPAGASPEDVLEGAGIGDQADVAPVLWPQGLVTAHWPRYLRSRWTDLRGDAGRVPALVRLARRARRQGVRECLVYGAGDAGRSLAAALRDEGVTIRGFVDRNERLWSSTIDGLPVRAPHQAMAGDCHTYVVGSMAFAHAIRQDLATLYASRVAHLKVVSLVENGVARHAA